MQWNPAIFALTGLNNIMTTAAFYSVHVDDVTVRQHSYSIKKRRNIMVYGCKQTYPPGA